MPRVKIIIRIEYEQDINVNPEAYEGATTLRGCIAKEKEYIREGGDYLFQALSSIPHEIKVRTEPLE